MSFGEDFAWILPNDDFIRGNFSIYLPPSLSLSICQIILVRATKEITKCKVYLFRRIQTEWNKTKIVQMFKIVVHPVELSHIRGCG